MQPLFEDPHHLELERLVRRLSACPTWAHPTTIGVHPKPDHTIVDELKMFTICDGSRETCTAQGAESYERACPSIAHSVACSKEALTPCLPLAIHLIRGFPADHDCV